MLLFGISSMIRDSAPARHFIENAAQQGKSTAATALSLDVPTISRDAKIRAASLQTIW